MPFSLRIARFHGFAFLSSHMPLRQVGSGPFSFGTSHARLFRLARSPLTRAVASRNTACYRSRLRFVPITTYIPAFHAVVRVDAERFVILRRAHTLSRQRCHQREPAAQASYQNSHARAMADKSSPARHQRCRQAVAVHGMAALFHIQWCTKHMLSQVF